MPVRATVVIATRNRCEDLLRAIESSVRQTATPEVLVLDDCSDDETVTEVRKQFPNVSLRSFPSARGCVVLRNVGARMAKGDYVFSIDDDAVFSSQHVVETTLANFDNARVGAIAIPLVEPNRSSQMLQSAPRKEGDWLTDSYIGTAYAVRRDLFIGLGGYREYLQHQGEERDFCLRLLAAGYVTKLGRGDPIYHFESQRRDYRRMDFFGRRNDVLFALQNVPSRQLVMHLAGTLGNGIIAAWRARRLRWMLCGMAAGLAEIAHVERRPVATRVYKLNRLLRKAKAVQLAEIISLLPSMALIRDLV